MAEVLPRLEDVAREAGVSLATASRVLGGSSYPVSEVLRDRVLAAANRLDYVPNAHARALASSATTTVGLVVHDISDPYFAEIARGVIEVAERHDRLVMICNTYRDPERERAYLATLRSQRVAAVVLAGSGFTDRATERAIAHDLESLAALGVGVALVGRHGSGRPSVVPDNQQGGALAARHLLELGHRRIAILSGPSTLTTVRDRLAGARAELRAAGVRPVVVESSFDRDGGAAAAVELLSRAPRVTAALALADAMAVGALAAFRDRGVVVPDALSVVGYDDIPTARDVTPALTTVRLPMREMGRRAARLALGLVDPADEAPLAVDLVIRASTAPPRVE